MNKSMRNLTWAIRYGRPLLNGFESEGTTYGRWILSLAWLLSQKGHRVDIYTPFQNQTFPDILNVRFLDIAGPWKKKYDIALINGWEDISYSLPEAHLYIYLNYTKSWLFQRKDHFSFIKRDDVIFGYPYGYLKDYFDTDNEFSDKCFLFPRVLRKKFRSKYNYDEKFWAVTWKFPGHPTCLEDITKAEDFVIQQAPEYNNYMKSFPRGGKPEYEVWKALENIRLLHPLREGGCNLEMVINGGVSLNVYNSLWHSKVFLFKEVALKHGIYLEHPIDFKRYKECIDYILSDRNTYEQIVDDCRKTIQPNIPKNAYNLIQNTCKDFI